MLFAALWCCLWICPAAAGPHQEHAELAEAGLLAAPVVPATRVRPSPRPPEDRPDVQVYGYLAYWADDLDTLRWDALTHLALFTAHAEPDGSLTETSKWGDIDGALARAEPLGIRIHLTVANFNTSELRTLLGSETARARLIDALAAEVDRTGVHGVNVDFEGLPADRRTQMVSFVRELQSRVPEVVLATPAVDWSDSWDYGALTDHADLFIMGYGYHWSGSTYAGPVDPLLGGDPWSAYSLDWSAKDYVSNGADPERVILGLPLYGYAWRTASDAVPSEAQAKGEVLFYTDGADLIASHGRRFDAASRTPWTWDGSRQGWFSDADSVRERTKYAVDSGLGGVGFWALNYDARDDVLWDGVRIETDLDDDPDTGDTDVEDPDTDPPGTGYRADAGQPFLAYVGDPVELSAEWSTGPEPLAYRWIQTGGPPVTLDDATAQRPRFTIQWPGAHTFEVRVGDGELWSEAATSTVVGVEPDLASTGCAGCRGSGAAGAPWLAVWLGLGLVGLRRRGR